MKKKYETPVGNIKLFAPESIIVLSGDDISFIPGGWLSDGNGGNGGSNL